MIVILNACGTNFSSIQFAIERLGKQSILTSDVALIQSADYVILPGVGTAHQAMLQLEQIKLIDVIKKLTQPVLGICLGMQILYALSHEGNVNCLNIMPGTVRAFPTNLGLSVPHIGWNQLHLNKDSQLLESIANNSYVYFVHSYAAPLNDDTLAVCEYGIKFPAAVQNKNFYGVQFHPERSGEAGEKILQNFLQLGYSR